MYVLCKLLSLLFQNKIDSGKTLKNPNKNDCWRPWLGKRVVILPKVCTESLIWCFSRSEEGDKGNFDSSESHLKAERAKMPGCGRQIIMGNIYNGNSRWEIASEEPVGDKTQLGDKAEEDPRDETGLSGGFGGVLDSWIFWGVCWIRWLIYRRKN